MTTFDLLQPATAAQRIVGSRGASRSWPHWLRLVVGVVSRTVLGTLVGLLLWAAVPAVIGWTPTTVMTGSMEPRIHPGDVVVAKPVAETEIHRGQVLLFQDPDRADHLRLHRYDDNGQGTQIVTKGDANPTADSTPIDRSAVVGVGYLVGGTLEAGLAGLVWGGLVRIFAYQHATFAVNSICHMFGRRHFRSRDESRNNLLIAVLVFGEPLTTAHIVCFAAIWAALAIFVGEGVRGARAAAAAACEAAV